MSLLVLSGDWKKHQEYVGPPNQSDHLEKFFPEDCCWGSASEGYEHPSRLHPKCAAGYGPDAILQS